MGKNLTILSRLIRNYFLNSLSIIKKYRVRSKIRQYSNRNKPFKLDLGCGSLKRRGFIGIDLSPDADIQWDLCQGIPFDDNTVSVIRSDHFFEHLDLPELNHVLKECNRVLIFGGILEFSVPHIDPFIHAYLDGDFDFLREKICDIPGGQEDLYSTCFDRISWLLYRAGEHKSMFDRESIIAKVRFAGFDTVTPREYDPQKDINPRFSSIYVVAIK